MLPRHLNKHIDYAQRPAPPSVQARTASPRRSAWRSRPTARRSTSPPSARARSASSPPPRSRTTRFVPDADDHIAVSGGGPTGLVLDEARGRLYVVHALRQRDLGGRTPTTRGRGVARAASTRRSRRRSTNGRRFLYDAQLTSSNGEASCSSCHIFGDFDSLAWDLGNPDDVVIPNPLPVQIAATRHLGDLPPAEGTDDDAEPARHGEPRLDALARRPHRRQRSGRQTRSTRTPRSRSSTSAFPGLHRPRQRADRRRDAGVHRLHPDRHLSAEPDPPPRQHAERQPAAGPRPLLRARSPTRVFNCNGCHTTRLRGRLLRHRRLHARSRARRRCSRSRTCATPIRRSACSAARRTRPSRARRSAASASCTTAASTPCCRFLGASVFSLTDAEQHDLERFVLAFDSNLAPIVGQQITLNASNGADRRRAHQPDARARRRARVRGRREGHHRRRAARRLPPARRHLPDGPRRARSRPTPSSAPSPPRPARS